LQLRERLLRGGVTGSPNWVYWVIHQFFWTWCHIWGWWCFSSSIRWGISVEFKRPFVKPLY
jgi:hypothetical protein